MYCCHNVGNMDVRTSAFERAQQQTKELSRIQVNTAIAFEDTARSVVNA